MNIDVLDKLQLEIADFVGKSVAVLGITGSGKTNTAAVLIEELLANGFPLTIIDIEGEYWGLKEQFQILVAGRSEHVDLEVNPDQAASLAELSAQKGLPIILDLSEFDQEEMFDFLLAYFTRLWAVLSSSRKPYMLILEEAHEFIPQSVRTPLKQMITRIALRGRKRGIGIILMSQRSAKVEKDVLTQTRMLFLHRVIHPTDMAVYKDLIPLPGKEVDEIVGKLHPGEAIVVYNNEVKIAQIRLRQTFHAGATPELGAETAPKLQMIDAALLQELRITLKAEKQSPDTEQARLMKRITELELHLGEKEQLLAEQAAAIAKLQERIEILSKLEIKAERQHLAVPITNPKTLEIEQARIGQLITGGSVVPCRVELKPLATHETQVEQGKREANVPQATQIQFLPAEKDRFDRLMRVLQKLTPRNKRILHLLAEHHPNALRGIDISVALGLDAETISQHPPIDLLRTPIVKRERGAHHAYVYRLELRSYTQQTFPRFKADVIVAFLLEKLKQF